MRYFEYEDKLCRGLAFDPTLYGANQQRLTEQNVFISKIPRDNFHTSKWLHDFVSEKFGKVKSLKISLESDHLSRGYGYVCFEDVSSANECLK